MVQVPNGLVISHSYIDCHQVKTSLVTDTEKSALFRKPGYWLRNSAKFPYR